MTVARVLWLVFLFGLMTLTAWRLTRFAVADFLPFVRVPRDLVVNWLDPRDENGAKTQTGGKEPPLGGFGRGVAYLLTCPWCMSFWMALGVVWVTTNWYSVPAPWLAVGAIWGAAGWLSAIEGWAEEWWRLTKNRRYEVRKNLGLPYTDESEL